MINKVNFLIGRLLLAIVYWLVASGLLPVYASPTPANEVDINRDFPFFSRFGTVGSLVNVLLPNVLIFAGIILLVYTVMGGFNMIRGAGSGDAEAAGKAKQTLTYGLVGFVIIFTAALVIKLIEFLTGISIFNPEQTQFK